MATQEKISSRLMGMQDDHAERSLRILLAAAQADITALRTQVAALTGTFKAIMLTTSTGVTGDTTATAFNAQIALTTNTGTAALATFTNVTAPQTFVL